MTPLSGHPQDIWGSFLDQYCPVFLGLYECPCALTNVWKHHGAFRAWDNTGRYQPISGPIASGWTGGGGGRFLSPPLVVMSRGRSSSWCGACAIFVELSQSLSYGSPRSQEWFSLLGLGRSFNPTGTVPQLPGVILQGSLTSWIASSGQSLRIMAIYTTCPYMQVGITETPNKSIIQWIWIWGMQVGWPVSRPWKPEAIATWKYACSMLAKL